MTQRGMFITLEGGEGAGKSTAIREIIGALRDAGVACLETREPGGTKLGESLRDLLLNPDWTGVEPIAELLMMFAARSQHLGEVIVPALERGEWVISDRFTDATYAYQGAGRAIGIETVAKLEQLVQGSLRPDKTLLLDVPVGVGLARAKNRGELDRFEREELLFFERVRLAYLDQVQKHPSRYHVIDAELPATHVAAELRDQVEILLDEWRAAERLP